MVDRRGRSPRPAAALRAVRRAHRRRTVVFRLRGVVAPDCRGVPGLRLAFRAQRGLRRLPQPTGRRSPRRSRLSPTPFRLTACSSASNTAAGLRSPNGPGRRSPRPCASRSPVEREASAPSASWRCRSRRSGSASEVSTRRAKFPSTSPVAPACRSPIRSSAFPPVRRRPRCPGPSGGEMSGARSRRQSDVRGARIALVDDVMTTGATLSEAARTLVEAGAERVECWVVARTLPP